MIYKLFKSVNLLPPYTKDKTKPGKRMKRQLGRKKVFPKLFPIYTLLHTLYTKSE